MQYLDDLYVAVTALPVDSVLGGVFLALVLTAPLGLAYAVGRRRGKDVSMVIVSLATATNLAGMALAIQHAEQLKGWTVVRRAEASSERRLPPPPWSPGHGSPFNGRARPGEIVAARITPGIFSEGDADHDGRLSVAEGAALATTLLKSSAPKDVASIGEEEMRKVIAGLIEPGLWPPFPPPPAPPAAIR